MSDMITVNTTATAARFEARMQGIAQRVFTEGGAAVRTQALDVRAVLIATSPVDTGNFRSRWEPVMEQGSPLAWGVGNDTIYGPILEYGGYRGVGPRTVQSPGGDFGYGFRANPGIYSRQAPLGFVRRALAGAATALTQRVLSVMQKAWSSDAMGGGWPLSPMAPIAPATDLGALFGIDIVGGMERGGLSGRAQAMAQEIMGSLRTSKGRQRP